MALGNVPRCMHIKTNGTQCGSPALRYRRQCFFHERARAQHNRIVKSQFKQARFVMPVLEDANAVQMALMQVMQLLAWGEMDRKVAALLLYGLQTASSNLRNVDFEPSEPTNVVINRENVQWTDIGSPQWDPDDFYMEDEEDEKGEKEEVAEEKETDAVMPVAAAKDSAAAEVTAAEDTADSLAASVDGSRISKAEPNIDEVRKKVQGLIRNYIAEATGPGRELSG